MKIALISPHFPPHHIGGVEIYVKRLADELHRRGNSPEVICIERVDRSGTDVLVERDAEYGYPVHRLHVNGARLGGSLAASYGNADVRHAVDRVLETMEPDVLHLHSGYLLGAAALATAHRRQIPTVVTLHDFWFICPRITMVHPGGEPCTGPESPTKCAWCLATEKRRYRTPDRLTGHAIGGVLKAAGRQRVFGALLKSVPAVNTLATRRDVLAGELTRVNVILSPSRFLRDRVAEAGVPAERITISRYGIDIRSVPRPERRAGTPLRVGYLGQLAPHKGVHVLVEAVTHLRDAPLTLRLYGDPYLTLLYVRRLQEAAAGDQRIAFSGPYKHGNVYDILSDLDVIVVPSVWYENSPFVIQEAQSAHVPVVASRLGGMRELVTDEHDGLLFEAGNASDLSRQLQRLVADPGLLGRLRPDGRSVRGADDEMLELLNHYSRLLTLGHEP